MVSGFNRRTTIEHIFQYITADEPSQESPEGLTQDSENELAMGENVDLNEKFVCPPHEGLPIPTQPGFQNYLGT